MNSYPGMFKYLSGKESLAFIDAANADFEAAGDEMIISAVTHPVYRRQLGLRLMAQAEKEFAREPG